MNAKQSFKQCYRIARTNRKSIHLLGETFRFGNGGCISLTGGEIFILREGVYLWRTPGWRAAGINAYRHYSLRYGAMLDARNTPHVRLP